MPSDVDQGSNRLRLLPISVPGEGDRPGRQVGRQLHLGDVGPDGVDGEIPKALAAVGADLLAVDPDIRPIDILAVK